MSLGSLIRGARPLGQLVWWTSLGIDAPVSEVNSRWLQHRLPPVASALPGALAQTCRELQAIPLLLRDGVVWVAPDFEAQVESLRSALSHFRGWQLHSVPVRSTGDTLEALRASALRFLEAELGGLTTELEPLLTQPRQRASLLVRSLDTVESLRAQAALQARHLGLTHEGLETHLDLWARRIDAALCARIVA